MDIKQHLNPLMDELDRNYSVKDDAQALAVVRFACKLFLKNPSWKFHRIIRYTVEHFKLKPKVVENETNQV